MACRHDGKRSMYLVKDGSNTLNPISDIIIITIIIIIIIMMMMMMMIIINNNKAPLFDTIEHNSFRILTAILLLSLCAMNILLLL